MPEIHPTAIIHSTASLASDVTIGPYVVIGAESTIADGCRIMHGAHIGPWTVLGTGNVVYPGAVIGQDPQDLGYGGERSFLFIGNGNVIREGCTIHRANGRDGRTVIGDQNFFMANSHVAHDCRVGNRVVLVNGALLGGHSQVMDGTIISGNCAVHQFVKVGRLALMRGGSMASRDIPPFCTHDDRNRIRSLNQVGLKRNGFDPEQIAILRKAFHIIFRSGRRLSLSLELVEDRFGSVPAIREMLLFIRSSERGICSGRRP